MLVMFLEVFQRAVGYFPECDNQRAAFCLHHELLVAKRVFCYSIETKKRLEIF
jgi:hypothetical protein